MANRIIIHSDNQLAPKTMRLALAKDLRLTITGKSTGKVYFFDGAGSELDVDEQDAIKFLEIIPPNSCCGGNVSSPYFEIVR